MCSCLSGTAGSTLLLPPGRSPVGALEEAPECLGVGPRVPGLKSSPVGTSCAERDAHASSVASGTWYLGCIIFQSETKMCSSRERVPGVEVLAANGTRTRTHCAPNPLWSPREPPSSSWVVCACLSTFQACSSRIFRFPDPCEYPDPSALNHEGPPCKGDRTGDVFCSLYVGLWVSYSSVY